MPITRGGTPATVAPQNLARMGWLSSMALERRIRRTAAAVSTVSILYCFQGWKKTHLRR
jgi:hypothetical protein